MTTGTSYEPPGSKSETRLLIKVLLAVVVFVMGIYFMLRWYAG